MSVPEWKTQFPGADAVGHMHTVVLGWRADLDAGDISVLYRKLREAHWLRSFHWDGVPTETVKLLELNANQVFSMVKADDVAGAHAMIDVLERDF